MIFPIGSNQSQSAATNCLPKKIPNNLTAVAAAGGVPPQQIGHTPSTGLIECVSKRNNRADFPYGNQSHF
jgi:hypothetical protein